MDRRIAIQGAVDYGYASNPCTATSPNDAPIPNSPVSQAIQSLRDEISEVHYHADSLIGHISPALRAAQPTSQELKERPAMASALAEDIQQLADVLRAARDKLVNARERLTL